MLQKGSRVFGFERIVNTKLTGSVDNAVILATYTSTGAELFQDRSCESIAEWFESYQATARHVRQ